MAKRFTDTNKYKKSFHRSLPGPYKLFWDYLYHDCDHAGIWHVDIEIAQIYLGKDMLIDKAKALELFNADEERVVVLNGGSKWFIRPFITFQYGELNPENRAHASVLALLLKDGISYFPNKEVKPLTSPLEGAMDMDKDMDKDKDKDWGKKKNRKPLTGIPDNFFISDRVKIWAKEKGHVNLDEHLESFRRKVAAKEYKYADWDAAFMEAIRENWAKIKTHGTPPPAATGALAKQRAEEALIEAERKK